MGTRIRYPNGVVVSANGRFMYMNEFAGRQVFKYDLENDKVIGSVKVDFLPDNLTWTKEGKLLAAGVKGARGDCPEGSGRPCIQGFGVAEIDPAKMQARPIFDSAVTRTADRRRVGGVEGRRFYLPRRIPGRSPGEDPLSELATGQLRLLVG